MGANTAVQAQSPAAGKNKAVGTMHTRSKYVYHYFWVLLGLWGLVIAVLIFNEYRHQEQAIRETAAAEATAYLNKEQATRMWAAARGGVYVPVSEQTPPNPFLRDVPERDIQTPGGQKLTLMNPAYFTRQIMDQYAAQYDVRGHITSLDPTRPETTPDAWERDALLAFEEGAHEVAEITAIEGRPYLRIMKPLVAEAQCLKCHATQVNRIGDIRGGVSVALPMDAYRKKFRKAMAAHGLSLGVLWLLGSMGLGFVTWKLALVMKKHDQAESLLRADEKQLKRLFARLFNYQDIQRKSVAHEIHEEIAQSLAAIKLRLETLVVNDPLCHPPLAAHIMELSRQIDAVVQLARQVTKRISPIVMDDLGVKTAVLSLCRHAMQPEASGQIETHIEMDERLVPDDLKIVLYRILEELLSLASRHCRDGRCAVSIHTSDEKMVLEIQLRNAHLDRLTAGPEGELSIAVVRHRAASSGAALTIDSDEAGITTIRVCWPLGEKQ
jgi:signal transduction histidine kinase